MFTNIEYNIDLFALLMILGIGQGIFLSLIFLIKGGSKNNSNLFLGLFLISLSLWITDTFLCHTRFILNAISFFSFANSMVFAIGPLFFMYIHTQLYGNTLRLKWLHFLPFILYFFYYFFLTNLQSDAYKFNIYIWAFDIDLPKMQGANEINYWFINKLGIQNYYIYLAVFHISTYISLSFSSILKHTIKTKSSFFKIKDARVKWLRNLALAMLLFFLIAAFIKLFIARSTENYIIVVLLSGIIYFISLGLISNSLFLTKDEQRKILKGKYVKSTLSEIAKQELLTQIKQLMINEKLYKDNLFSLGLLAKKARSSTNYVSQVINECCNQTFYDFVAEYRINEAKKLLADNNTNKKLSIEEIAFEVGYNSKPAFNNTFKKLTGQTPSEFRSTN